MELSQSGFTATEPPPAIPHINLRKWNTHNQRALPLGKSSKRASGYRSNSGHIASPRASRATRPSWLMPATPRSGPAPTWCCDAFINFDPQILSRNRKFRRNFDTLFEDLHGTVKFAPHKLGPTGLLLAACLACATVRSQCRLIGCSVLSPAFLALSAGVVVVTWFARTGVGMYG